MFYSLWKYFEKGNLNSLCFQLVLANAKLVWIIVYMEVDIKDKSCMFLK